MFKNLLYNSHATLNCARYIKNCRTVHLQKAACFDQHVRTLLQTILHCHKNLKNIIKHNHIYTNKLGL
uniref:Uncharacterized protein n=1 Tax=Anguilla anguilla TaxID=7936 RepID=A0A0E9W2T9_ANGAN